MKKIYLLFTLIAFISCLGNNAFSQSTRKEYEKNRQTPQLLKPVDEVMDAEILKKSLNIRTETDRVKVLKNLISDQNLRNVQNSKKTVSLDNSGSGNNTEAVNIFTTSGPSANTYTAITGTSPASWRAGANPDDNLSNTVPLNFPFVYEGIICDSVLIGTNGFVTFNINTGVDGTTGTPYGSTPTGMTTNSILAMAPFWEDLEAANLSQIKYETSGPDGAQIFTVQWSSMNLWEASPAFNLNFQLKIYEADSHIEFVYGTMTAGTTGPNNPLFYVCGINGISLSPTPTAAELLIQQTPNGTTFSNAVGGGAGFNDSLNVLVTGGNKISFTPPAQTAPNAPTALNFTGTTGSSTYLNWTDNSSNETGFPVYMSEDNSYFFYLGTVPANTDSVEVVGLNAVTTYYFRVYASVETKISAPASGNVTTIGNPLSGAYTINPAGSPNRPNFQSFFACDTALENNGVSGPVVISVTGGIYTEKVQLFSVPNTSSTNTVKFVGPTSAEARVVIKPVGTAALTDVAIQIIGADYITYENIDVEDGGTSTADQVERGYELDVFPATDDPNNYITIKGANITMGGGGTPLGLNSAGVLIAYNQTVAGTLTGNLGCKYQNLNINRADRGIFTNLPLPFLTIEEDSTEISGCKFGQTTYIGTSTSTSNAIGIFKRLETNVKVFNNILYSVKTNSTAATGGATGIAISGASGYCYNNQVLEVYQGSNVSAAALSSGIVVGAFATILPVIGDVHTYNNFVANVTKGYTGVATATVGVYGLRGTLSVTPVSTTVNDMYYNTVYLSAPGTVNYSSACFSDNATATAFLINVRDNIFINNISSAGVARGSTIFEQNASPLNDIVSDYNNLYASGAQTDIGRRTTLYYNTLASWTAATGMDANSSNQNVSFVNAATGDLHLAGASKSDPLLTGVAIAGITTDIDGNTRSSVKPFKGADEPTGTSALTLKINFQACPSVSTIYVLLRNSTSPYAIVDSVAGIGGGSSPCIINFNSVANGTPYYVVVRSVNAIETWSSGFVTFSSGAASYDFTTALSQAYLSNQILSSGIPSIYQGDVNQDGFVNTTDVISTYNNSAAFITSPSTDFNCDGTTDLSDVVLAFNNASNFVQKKRP